MMLSFSKCLWIYIFGLKLDDTPNLAAIVTSIINTPLAKIPPTILQQYPPVTFLAQLWLGTTIATGFHNNILYTLKIRIVTFLTKRS